MRYSAQRRHLGQAEEERTRMARVGDSMFSRAVVPGRPCGEKEPL